PASRNCRRRISSSRSRRMISITRPMRALNSTRCSARSTRRPSSACCRNASTSARNMSICRWSKRPRNASTANDQVLMSEAAHIVIDRVSHEYRPARRRPVLALDDVSLAVGEREFLALLGPSGCGKSTLLYLVGGFLPVEQGAIRVEEQPVNGPGPDRGIVFQHFALFLWKTVTQNVLYGLEKKGCRARSACASRANTSSWSGSPGSRTAIRRSCRAA